MTGALNILTQNFKHTSGYPPSLQGLCILRGREELEKQLKTYHDINMEIEWPKPITEAMCGLPKKDDPIGSVYIEIFS